jgi:signal peptidase II
MLCVFSIIFDQATKWSVLAFLPRDEPLRVMPFLNFVLTFNRGISFGLLHPNNLTEFYLIVILTILCILFLIYAFLKFKTILEQVLCAILIGGAVGNLLDRFFHGAVVDFIDVYYKNWHWPAFNFADCFISCSAVFLILINLFSSEK